MAWPFSSRSSRSLLWHISARGRGASRRTSAAWRGARRRRSTTRGGSGTCTRGVPAEDRALRHQARERAPGRRADAQGRRLRAGGAAGEPRRHARVRVPRARHAGVRRAGDVDDVGRHGEVRRVQLRHAPARDRRPAAELRRGGAREPAVVPHAGVEQVRQRRARGARRRRATEPCGGGW